MTTFMTYKEECEALRKRVAELEKERADLMQSIHDQANAYDDLCAEIELSDEFQRGRIETLSSERDALKKEVAQWKNHHETEVRRARVLKERTDMPIERVQAYEQWGKDMAERDALKQQRDELLKACETYMSHGICDVTYYAIRNAIASVKEKA